MFVEEIPEERFHSNRGRDKFIENVLNSLDNKVTDEEIDEVSRLLDISE